MMKRAYVLCFLLFLVCVDTKAQQLSLVINGKAFHVNNTDDRPLNEHNYGVGVQYDFARNGNWVPFATAATFRDSYDGSAWYAGTGALRRFDLNDNWYTGIGGVVFLMRHSDINDYEPFLAVLPAATIGTDRAALNLTYIPRVKEKGAAAYFIQLRIGFLN